MVPTPILTARAIRSAISASPRPPSCWRASAQAHCGHRPPRPAGRRRPGRRRAAAGSARAARAAARPSPRTPPSAPARGRGRPPRRGRGRRQAQAAAAGALRSAAQPSLGLRRREQRQPPSAPEADPAAARAPSEAHAHARRPPAGAEAEAAGHARAVKPPERGGDVGQQRRGDQRSPRRRPRGPATSARPTSLGQHRGGQQPRPRRRRRSGCASRPTLLEDEPDSRIDDEEPDEEAQEPERGQVEVEAIGQPLEIAGAPRRVDRQPPGKRPAGAPKPPVPAAAGATRAPRRRAAAPRAPISTMSVSGGSVSLASRAAGPARLRAAPPSPGAASARCGGSRNAVTRSPPVPICSDRASGGRVSGSIPITRTLSAPRRRSPPAPASPASLPAGGPRSRRGRSDRRRRR